MPRILITSGPTRQYLDPVRYLTNASSGRMGRALAVAAADGEFQPEADPFHEKLRNLAAGTPVTFCASSGVFEPFFWLQRLQAVARLVQV